MTEIPRYIPDEEKEPRREGVTLDDVKRFVAEHRHEPEFAATEQTPFWHLDDALFSFEEYCSRARSEGSPNLYRVREMTHFLDKETGSDWHEKGYGPYKVTALLLPEIAKRVSDVSYYDSRERLEAEEEHRREKMIIDEFSRNGERFEDMRPDEIEPVLGVLEERIAWIDHEIEREARQPNKGPRDERDRRARIKTLTMSRRPFRRARVFLFGQYFRK